MPLRRRLAVPHPSRLAFGLVGFATLLVVLAAFVPAADAATPAAETAYVTNYLSNSVTPINLATDTTEAAIPAGAGPGQIVITPDGSKAFVIGLFSDTVTPINLESRTALPAINLGGEVFNVAVAPDGKMAYVSVGEAGELFPINVATDAVGTPIPAGADPNGIAISPDSSTAYVTNYEANKVTPINLATGVDGTPIAVGRGPNGIAISPDGSTAWVGDELGKAVTKIDLTTDTAVAEIGIGTQSWGLSISPDGSKLYVAGFGSDTVTPITTATDTVGPKINFPGGIFYVAFSHDGQTAYAPAAEAGLIYPIDVATGTAQSPFSSGGREPIGIAIAPEPIAVGAPGAPTGLAGTFDEGKIDLTWSAPEDGTVDHYLIRPAIDGEVLPPVETTGAPTSYVYEPAGGLTAGRLYSFTVTAVNAAGEGLATPQQSVRAGIGVPAEPSRPTVVAEGGGVTLSWSAPLDGGGATIDHYQVIVTHGGVEGAPVETTGAATSYTVTGLTNGQSYTFTVAAVNEKGAGAPSEPSEAVTPHFPYSISLSREYLEGTGGDPTNPTIEVTVGEQGTEASALQVAAVASSDESVAAASGVSVTGTGVTRTVSVTPAGVGFTNITLRVTGPQGGSATAVIQYAASGAYDSTARWHVGAADASTAVDVGDGYMILGDDENNVLRLYKADVSGLPVKEWNFNSQLGNPGEIDIEASARSGGTIYWTGSMGNSKSGKVEAERSTLFTTHISGEGANTELTFGGYYRGLRADLIRWDEEHGNRLGFAAGAAEHNVPKQVNGFNVEGLEFAPGSSGTAYIGFRAPLSPAAVGGKAVVVPITNIGELAPSGQNTSIHATFGEPILMDLGGLSVREIRKNSDDEYLILAGSWAATGPQALYTWDGNPADPPVKTLDPLPTAEGDEGEEAGAWESIVNVPEPLASGDKVELVKDIGAVDLYGDNREAKEALNEFQKSPSDQFTLNLTEFSLTATPTGSGEGTIACDGGTCAADYAAGTAVTLTATPVPGSTFAGWFGACSGTGSCVTTMSGSRSVTAEFTKPAAPPVEEIIPPVEEHKSMAPVEETKSTTPTTGSGTTSTPQSIPPATTSPTSKSTPTKAETIAKERKAALKKCQAMDGEKKTKCVEKAEQIGKKKPKPTAKHKQAVKKG